MKALHCALPLLLPVLYNTSLMESDLHCIPVFCQVLARAAVTHQSLYGVS